MNIRCPKCKNQYVEQCLPEVDMGEETIVTECYCENCDYKFKAITDIEIRFFSTEYIEI